MEELMPELVGLVLSQVDHHGLVACRFVCTTAPADQNCWTTFPMFSYCQQTTLPRAQHKKEKKKI
jgi:hypothetical protein